MVHVCMYVLVVFVERYTTLNGQTNIFHPDINQIVDEMAYIYQLLHILHVNVLIIGRTCQVLAASVGNLIDLSLTGCFSSCSVSTTSPWSFTWAGLCRTLWLTWLWRTPAMKPPTR